MNDLATQSKKEIEDSIQHTFGALEDYLIDLRALNAELQKREGMTDAMILKSTKNRLPIIVHHMLVEQCEPGAF